MKQTTKRVVAFFAAMGLMVSGLSVNEPASVDAKAKANIKSVTIKNVKKQFACTYNRIFCEIISKINLT